LEVAETAQEFDNLFTLEWGIVITLDAVLRGYITNHLTALGDTIFLKLTPA
jgi:hypothetical protein